MTLKPWSTIQAGKMLASEFAQTPAIQTPAFLKVKALADHALALERRALPRRRNSDSNG
jgi:hypothetical protein